MMKSTVDAVDRRLMEFMVGAQAGDRRSYAALLGECEPIIRRVARRAGARPDLLDDVLQETLITLHNARHTYDPSRSFIAWITVIAQRRAIDLMRRSGRVGAREVHAPVEFERHADPHADAASGWREAGRASDLAEALASLTPGQREAVELIAVEGRSLSEAATRTGRSKGALKVNFHRALEALKRRLGAQERHDAR